MSDTETRDIVIRLPREHIRRATVSLHLRSPDLYRKLTSDPDRDVTESSADAGDPDNDWRFEVHGPLGGVVYQSHGDSHWVAIERLDGFA